MPLDADRVVELPWVAARVSEPQPQQVLDVASPKLLACWLAEHTASTVTAIDLWDAEIDRWHKLVAAVDPARRRFGGLVLEVGDVTRLAYPDASFDTALSVSVLEHIPGDEIHGHARTREGPAPWREARANAALRCVS